MSIRKRLSPQESRSAALVAARALLIEAGPQAVTLKAVAGRVGRTHANLLHHFGSASGLQKDLARHLAQAVCDSIADAVRATRAGIGSPREVVDLTFDAFGREGGGALASWMLASGNEDALDPIVETIHALVDDLLPEECAADRGRAMHETTFTLVLMALGDALLGEQLAESLAVERSVMRDRAEAMLVSAFDQAYGATG
ncbi:TetR family transcriptional regulator [Erythrobacter arachoides]|uniref:TetR family transcriptional regulator n=1 Tax=Aurantiacibacter arachoides TaxID=1850444 RepID=A0A845A0U8_9SPHN|nr:TetR family transcriptional regulator [Aurantiacibacter arachoides]MXO93745.1 TetR family transcriptional regulator [Aurantiacibacter arachoides]GGD46953.1 TetR family transcriptional regulator [Aurantiacibacter arachoides]